MVFSSILFLAVFLPIFLLCFYLTPVRFRKFVISAFSIIFYAWGAPVFILFLLFSSVLDYWITRQFNGQNKKSFLWASILLNVGLLVYFKYFNFFTHNAEILLEYWDFESYHFNDIVLPIGISFFTFQKISYSIDVYSGQNKPLDKFSDYLLFIIMFPQLIAGPIVRYKDVNLQIQNYLQNTFEFKTHGLYRFIIGLFKKVIIANTFAFVVNQINGLGIDSLSTSQAWTSALAYCFQIYYDFSGYSDMAIGLGLMMGFKFPENFNFPYVSKSITEFWQRWHITLGSWMRDYLYIPLGGNQSGRTRTYTNLIVVFFISGFWHGANWNFICWGLYHGLFLIMERSFGYKLLLKLPNGLQILYTFFVVLVGWVFFSMDMESAICFTEKLFSYHSIQTEVMISSKSWFWMTFGVFWAFIGISNNINTKLNQFYTWSLNGHVLKQLGIFLFLILILVLCFITLISSGFNPFIYYRF
ncbi:MAG: alginate O-acetyltransferase complex protein AlgI [Salibacteraceae bacterium]|jgi:alginate O-acetyltransferase complex protein AlgI